MRLWSLHPKYLDPRALVAVWREGLLAQAVLRGRTRGYRHHPQLARFRGQPRPLASLAEYLRAVHAEGAARGYRFAATRISPARAYGRITVTRGQLDHEWEHLKAKVKTRDPGWYSLLRNVNRPRAHPLFRVVPGDVADWERNPFRRAGGS